MPDKQLLSVHSITVRRVVFCVYAGAIQHTAAADEHADADRYAHGHANSNSYADADQHPNGHADTNGHTDVHLYADANTILRDGHEHTDTNPNHDADPNRHANLNEHANPNPNRHLHSHAAPTDIGAGRLLPGRWRELSWQPRLFRGLGLLPGPDHPRGGVQRWCL